MITSLAQGSTQSTEISISAIIQFILSITFIFINVRACHLLQISNSKYLIRKSMMQLQCIAYLTNMRRLNGEHSGVHGSARCCTMAFWRETHHVQMLSHNLPDHELLARWANIIIHSSSCMRSAFSFCLCRCWRCGWRCCRWLLQLLNLSLAQKPINCNRICNMHDLTRSKI